MRHQNRRISSWVGSSFLVSLRPPLSFLDPPRDGTSPEGCNEAPSIFGSGKYYRRLFLLHVHATRFVVDPCSFYGGRWDEDGGRVLRTVRTLRCPPSYEYSITLSISLLSLRTNRDWASPQRSGPGQVFELLEPCTAWAPFPFLPFHSLCSFLLSSPCLRSIECNLQTAIDGEQSTSGR